MKLKKIIPRLCRGTGLGIIASCIIYVFSSCGSGPALKTTDPDKGPFAINFPGNSSIGFFNFIDAGRGAGMLNSDITIEAWIKTSASGTIFIRMQASGIALYVDNNVLNFAVDSQTVTSTNTIVNDGNWHHVAGVLTGEGAHTHATSSTCSEAARSGIHADIYIDGNWINCTGPLTYPSGIDCNDCKNYIGRAEPDETLSLFRGVIDEVRLWKEARDKSVLLVASSTNYIDTWKSREITPDRFYDANPNGTLVGYWQFNEGNGPRALDRSGWGYNGSKLMCTSNCASANPLLPETDADWSGGWVAGYPF